VIFSIVFELILPLMPRTFSHTQDQWNAMAYLAGGVVAGCSWRWRGGEQVAFQPTIKLAEADEWN
jgi:hypothetical protein